MSRKPFIAGNWKMNTNLAEALELVNDIKLDVEQTTEVEILVCPPFVSLNAVSEAVRGSNIRVGAQNLHWEGGGAFTGEISGAMLKDFCHYVIIGHSERRALFAETDQTVNLRLKAALDNGLLPIVCVGETLDENEAGETNAVVGRQVREGVKGIGSEQAELLTIAYEPVWAIGTGKAATAADAVRVIGGVIRPILAEEFGEEITTGIRVLYGGSVKPSNAEDFFSEEDIDGALVGGASLKARDFGAIIKAAQR
jgi:triosephosphate isomerase (TIM)